ncbi:hypothetical protein FGRMN_10159 [Fusarium graminum]|nr:hypothetical protein FGRMN_10159 [Fusarium graminum]
MAWPFRLCLILSVLTWVVQSEECPGFDAEVGADIVSRVKFKWYPGSEILPGAENGVINTLTNILSLQDCANRCADTGGCKASLWNNKTNYCLLASETDGCQDGEHFHNSLLKVAGSFDDTDDNIGCSQQEVDTKCADREKAGRLEAEKECAIQGNDLRAEIKGLRAEITTLHNARKQAENEASEKETATEKERKDLIKKWQDRVDQEVNKSKADLERARDNAEGNCRSKQDKDLRTQREKLGKECDERIKADKAECERIESQCAENSKRHADNYGKCVDDLSNANQQQKDSDNKCAEAIRQKEAQSQQCTDNLKTVKDQQEESENQWVAEKADLQKQCDIIRDTDKTLLEATCQAEKDIARKQCAHDLNSAQDQQKQSENNCQSDKDVISKQCTQDLDAAENLQQQLKSECQAEKDTINKQCNRDVDAAKAQQQRLESNCQSEKDELEGQCNDRLAKEKETLDDTCRGQKDELRKECEDQCKARARSKDDICYNPGFGAWPDTIQSFDVDDTNRTPVMYSSTG